MSTFRVCTNSNFFFKPKLFSEEEFIERNDFYKNEDDKVDTGMPVDSLDEVGPVVESFEDIKEAVLEYDGDLRYPNAAAQECLSDFLVKAGEKTLNSLAIQELKDIFEVLDDEYSEKFDIESLNEHELAEELQNIIHSAKGSLDMFHRIKRHAQ